MTKNSTGVSFLRLEINCSETDHFEHLESSTKIYGPVEISNLLLQQLKTKDKSGGRLNNIVHYKDLLTTLLHSP